MVNPKILHTIIFCSNIGRYLLSFLLLLAVLSSTVCGAGSSAVDSPLEITQAAFRQAGCMEQARYDFHKDTIRALSYTKMRALRAFCAIPDIDDDEAVAALEKLVFYPLTFDQVRFFETFTDLDDISYARAWQLLELSSSLEFTAMQAVLQIPSIDGLDTAAVIELVNKINALDDYGRWAAKALFSISGIDRLSALQGIALLAHMDTAQRLSAEQSCLIEAMDPAMIIQLLPRIAALKPQDALNSVGLFSLETMTPAQALFWLSSYFSLPEANGEQHYYALSGEQKTTLLDGFAAASDYHIRKINDLHAVTNRYGGEISTGALAAGGAETIRALFAKLHEKARQRYGGALEQALAEKKIYPAIDVLKQATAMARNQTARDLSSANIYIVLSRGSELYDSSFRDVLVPVLLSRIKASFGGNLLNFLTQTDPGNRSVSDFIISCAQKGKLTAFFPKDGAEQRVILDLMAQSAFRDEQSLILFSATFAALLEKLEPSARSYLISKMADTIDKSASIFALQLRVILQYYLNKHPALLSADDRSLIQDLIQRYGAVDLGQYTANDFKRWKEDRNLRSLSIFQHDDDGKISYLSNSRNLLNNGYQPRLSTSLNLLPQNSPTAGQARRLMAQGDVASLYRLSVAGPLIIEYHKTVNNIELSHSVAVYQNEADQQRLLKQYLESGMEMFAQRGHSYWREEQLLKPMRQLLESGEISHASIPDINRFMSIGSCGGIRIYSELNRLFNNSVDIFATVGTGKAVVNDPYNQRLFEVIATSGNGLSWEEVARRLNPILSDERDSDYLQPGSLPAILHKMMDLRSTN
ncbi:MAG: hypothetical protein WBW79_19115 [Desulfocapsaceae bacterium]